MADDAANRDFVLLGIKYEAAKAGGVDETSLANIERQIHAEVGEGWETNAQVLRGRNAVRAEHGLSRLGGPVHASAPPPARRSLIDRLMRR